MESLCEAVGLHTEHFITEASTSLQKNFIEVS